MPTTQEHINKQSKIQFTLSDLQQSPNHLQHVDWIVTLAFYKALHAVDSYLAKLGIHPRGHTNKQKTGRNQYVQKHLRSIHGKYSTLYTASIKARYEAYTHKYQEVTRLVNHSVFIEEHIKTLL